ncbi:MAG: hypothetical protein DDG60_10360 [Anaerolineae bacterium]|nr:MAG: hypothetical protein DDG60_10360 [Anaerolineae bacterium]
MDTPNPPSIASFVIRFVIEPGASAYRGEIRHVQTGEEIRFDAWPEAVEFIRRFVPLEAEEPPCA